MSCNIVENVRDTFIKEGIIDSHNNIIGNTSKAYEKITSVNNELQNKYGYVNKGILIDTYQIPANFARSARVKMSFNEKFAAHIEGVENRTNKIFSIMEPGKTYKSSELLQAIYNIKTDPMSELAGKLIKFTKKNDVNISLKSPEDMGSFNWQGEYKSDSNDIDISLGAKDSTAYRTVVHEILHALTVNEIENNADSKLVKDLNKLYEDVLWLTDKKDLYGYKNVKEFAVAVLTDPKVIQDMVIMPKSGNVETSGNNILEQFINKILKLIGMKNMSNNILAQATQTVTDLLADESYYTNTKDFNFTSEQEEEYWNSIQSKYNDNFIDNSDFNDEPGGVQGTFDFDEPLNSPYADEDVAREDLITEYPASFQEWVDSRKQTLDNLKRVHDYYFKLDKKDPILEKVNLAIEEIEDQLENVDYSDPYTIFDNAVGEVEVLLALVDKAKNNPTDALDIMETNDLEQRITDLNFYFLGRDTRANDTAYNPELIQSDFYKDYKEHFLQFQPEKLIELENSINRLKNNFKDVKKSLVVSALKSNSYVKEHLRDGANQKFTAKDIQNIIDRIERGEYEVDYIGSRTLGLASGGGILGQLLKLRRDEAGDKEKAFVANKLAPLNKIWDKIKDKKVNGKFLTDKLYQTDKYGVRMGSLISKYSDNFSSISKQISAEANRFNTTKDARDYSILMKAEKDNYERIDVRMFPEIYEKYSQDPRFARDFEGVDDSKFEEYHNKLKAVLGPTMYEIEMKNAVELVEDFIYNYEKDMLTPLQKTVKNPFAFLRNFNSTDFDKKDLKTGRFLESTYTRFIPKLDEPKYYNDKFSEIEQDQDLVEFYKGAYDIVVNYTNPTFQGEDLKVGLLDLETFEDLLERNSYKDLSLVGKVNANLKALIRNRVQRYADASLANMDKRLEDEKHNRQKLVVARSSTIQNNITKIKQAYAVMDPVVIIQRAKSELGIDINPYTIYKVNANGLVRLPAFYELAESLARNQLNKITSTNIMESLHNSSYLSADTRAKRSVVAMLEAFKDIANTATVSKGNASEKVNNTNIGHMLYMWGQTNIYGEKFAGNMENKGRGFINNITKFKFFGAKVSSGADKLTVKEIERILKFTDGNLLKDFQLGNENYSVQRSKDGNKFFKNDKEISIEQFKKDYLKHLKENISTEVTIGSLLLGYMEDARGIQLGLSPRAGIKNRIAGMSQTMSVAASGRFGFNLNQYHASRRFLRGINTRQYISKLGWGINDSNPKYVQIRMLEDLISRLELQQNRADELAMEAKFNSVAGSQKVESLKNFLMDFAMNNPEKHNQLEIAVSLMMNTNVTDNEGNMHKFFDEKSLQFNIYKPGTLELKDEFRNEKNEVMWEQFKTYKDPNSNEQYSESIAMTTRIRTTIEQTQGNYNNDDIIMLQNTVHGKLGTMYTRYMYENTNLQFGNHYVDLRTGEMNIKGRKINLMEHAPTTTIYLMSNFAVPLVAGSFAFVAASPFLAAIVGISGAFGLGLLWKHKSLNLKSMASLKEWNLAKDFALETLALMGKTPLNTLSYGTINPGILDKSIGKLQAKTYGGMLTEKDRKLLSECAQEVATKFTNYAMYTLTALLAKFLFTALVGGDDDDDDDTYVQKKIRELVNIENVVNGLLNDRNQVLSDINRYLSPENFYNDATAFSLFRTLSRDYGISKKVLTGGYNKEPLSTMIYDISKMAWIPGANMVPNNAKKAIAGMFNRDLGVFSDNRVYEGKDVLDKLAGKKMKKGEDYYKAEAKDLRKDIRDDAKKYFTKEVENENIERSPSEIEDEINLRLNSFMNNLDKNKDQTYKDLIESEVFKYKREELDSLIENYKK